MIRLTHKKSEMSVEKPKANPVFGADESAFSDEVWVAMARVLFPKMPVQAAETALLARMARGKPVNNKTGVSNGNRAG
jgi:hypothetical protein